MKQNNKFKNEKVNDQKKKWVNYVGQICEGKEKGSHYIKVTKDFDALIGNSLTIVPVKEYYESMVQSGIIPEKEAEEKLAKSPWVKYVLHLPPQEDKGIEDKYKRTSEKGWVSNALSLCEGEKKVKYLKVNHSFSVKKDQVMHMKKYIDDVENRRERGFLDDKQYEKAMEHSTWLHYLISIAPPKQTKE